MSLSLREKKGVVGDVAAVLAAAQGGVLAEYRGLDVAQLTELRAAARGEGVWVRVVKNSLAKRAIEGSEFACLAEHLVGPVLFSAAEDPVAVARVMARFAKDNEHFNITAGVMNGELMDPHMIDRLAKLPGRAELIATLMATMCAPVQRLVSTLNEIPTRLVRVSAAVVEAKESA